MAPVAFKDILDKFSESASAHTSIAKAKIRLDNSRQHRLSWKEEAFETDWKNAKFP